MTRAYDSISTVLLLETVTWELERSSLCYIKLPVPGVDRLIQFVVTVLEWTNSCVSQKVYRGRYEVCCIRAYIQLCAIGTLCGTRVSHDYHGQYYTILYLTRVVISSILARYPTAFYVKHLSCKQAFEINNNTPFLSPPPLVKECGIQYILKGAIEQTIILGLYSESSNDPNS